MNNIKKNSKIFFILFVTFISGLSGSIYNSKLKESWFIKYEMDLSPKLFIYGKIIDNNIYSLQLPFFKNTEILDFTQMKSYKNEIFLNERIKKADITPDNITLYINGPLDSIEDDLNSIIVSLNKFLQSELNILLTNLIEQANIFFDKKQSIKMQKYLRDKNLKDIYNNTDIPIIIENKNILIDINENFTDSNKKKFEEIMVNLDKLQKLFRQNDNLNQILNKRKIENLKLQEIKEIKNKLIEAQIYKLSKLLQKADLRPKMSVSIIAFSLTGFFISFFIIVIFGLFEPISKKKIFKFFGIYQ